MEKLSRKKFRVESMRSAIARARIQVCRKLIIDIKKLSSNKADSKTEKNARKIQRLNDEVHILKYLKPNTIATFVLSHSKETAERFREDPNAVPQIRVLAKVSLHKLIRPLIKEFHQKYPKWQEILPKLLTQEGRKEGISTNEDSVEENGCNDVSSCSESIDEVKLEKKSCRKFPTKLKTISFNRESINNKKLCQKVKNNVRLKEAILRQSINAKNKWIVESITDFPNKTEENKLKNSDELSSCGINQKHSHKVKSKTKDRTIQLVKKQIECCKQEDQLTNRFFSETEECSNSNINLHQENMESNSKAQDEYSSNGKTDNGVNMLNVKVQDYPECLKTKESPLVKKDGDNKQCSTQNQQEDPFFMTTDNQKYMTYGKIVDDTKESPTVVEVADIKKSHFKTHFNERNSFNKINKGDRNCKDKVAKRLSLNTVVKKQEALHPSWEAKKKKSVILPFEGKKISFDDI